MSQTTPLNHTSKLYQAHLIIGLHVGPSASSVTCTGTHSNPNPTPMHPHWVQGSEAIWRRHSSSQEFVQALTTVVKTSKDDVDQLNDRIEQFLLT